MPLFLRKVRIVDQVIPRPTEAVYHLLGDFTYEQKQALEDIAAAEAVHGPDSVGSRQAWVKSILKKGVAQGLLDKDIIDTVLKLASSCSL